MQKSWCFAITPSTLPRQTRNWLSQILSNLATAIVWNISGRAKPKLPIVFRFVAFALAICLSAPAFATDVLYYYDELGRLIEVVDTSGNTAQYAYDAAGNITAIQSVTGSTLSLNQFVPRAAQVGATIVIYGSGFNSTPSNNTVKFNGTTATVSAGTTTTLTVTVPSGATTGTMSVQNSSGTVTSSSSFTVATSQAPTITGISPSDGVSGTSSTVTGTNFQTTDQQNNSAVIGLWAAPIQSVTSTSITLTSGTSSGKVSISTPYGTAVSSSDFFSLPSGVSHSTLEVTGRIVAGGSPVTVTTTVNGNQGLLLFDANKGDYLSVLVNSNTFPSPLPLSFFGPDGAPLASYNYADTSVDFPSARLGGTYTIALIPPSTDQGSMQLQLISDPVTAVTVNGTTSVSLTTGQKSYLTFSAQANIGYAVQFSNLSFTPSGGYPYLTVTLSDTIGAVLKSCAVTAGTGCYFPPSLFLVGGVYTVKVQPMDSVGTNYAASFDVVTSKNLTGTLAIDAATPTTLTTSVAGQGAQYTFSGTAGQNITLVLTNNSIGTGSPPTSVNTNISVYAPFSTSWTTTYSVSTGVDGVLTLQNLPDTGTYTIVVAPVGPGSGSLDLQLKSFATGTLTVNGTTSISLTTGQSATYTFSATANTGYTLTAKNLTFTPTGDPGMYMELSDPSGNLINSCSADIQLNCNFDPSNFASNGTYTLSMWAGPPNTSGAYASSFDAVVSTNVTGTLTVNAGSATTVTTTKEGQNARYTFSGTAGQYISLILTSNTLDDGDPGSGNTITFYARGPSGLLTAVTLAKGAVGTLDIENLPSTGTYTIVMTPLGNIKGSIAMQLKTYATGSVTVNSTKSIPLTSGQKGKYTFSGVANTGYGFAVTSLVLTPTATTPTLQLRINDPSGNTIGGGPVDQGTNCYLAPSSITSTGTYTIFVDPGTDSTSQVYSVTGNLILSKDVTGTLTVNAASATTVTISFKGQNARYSFSGTSGQNLKLLVSNNNIPTPSTSFAIYGPSSSLAYSGSVSVGAGGTILMSSLPSTGTYKIVMTPSGSTTDSGTGNIKLQVKTQ